MRSRNLPCRGLWLAALAAVLASGCSKGPVRVDGLVTLNDAPLGKVYACFVPEGPGRHARRELEAPPAPGGALVLMRWRQCDPVHAIGPCSWV